MRFAWLTAAALTASALVALGCGDNLGVPDAHGRVDASRGSDAATGSDASVPSDANATPATVQDTGLCADVMCLSIAADVNAYAPQFTLFADGATKLRWFRLPTGAKIDTTDMDHWVFPVGTQFWKEFTDEHGVRIETRYMTKLLADDSAPNAWFYVSYAWTAGQTANTPVTAGVQNANGTTHDIPSRQQCKSCHENLKPTRVLGFGAISLDYKSTTTGDVDLDGMIAKELLTTNPPGAVSPHYPLPGTAAEQAALGYLHANCGHCHNSTSAIVTNNESPIQLRLDTLHLASTAVTPTYTTSVGVNGHVVVPMDMDCPTAPATPCSAIPQCPTTPAGAGSCLVDPADLLGSTLLFRFTSTNHSLHMPALGTKTTDPAGTAVLSAWVTGL